MLLTTVSCTSNATLYYHRFTPQAHSMADGNTRGHRWLQSPHIVPEGAANNKASTLYEFFLNAVQEFNLPSRVRSDQGLENVMVAKHMLEKRGSERKSMITGSSTHNQRIERLWRDMHSSVTVLFYKLFYFMEEQGLLDPLHELTLWALHYVFMPRINRSLTEFIRGWNNHSIRTAHHKTPQQLFTAGCLILQNSGIDALDFGDTVGENYGIDPDSNIATDEHAIEVPQNTIGFSATDIQALKQAINPLDVSENYGIDLYEETLHFISNFTVL